MSESSEITPMCRNCAFDVNGVCIKCQFAICNDDQCCNKYIQVKTDHN